MNSAGSMAHQADRSTTRPPASRNGISTSSRTPKLTETRGKQPRPPEPHQLVTIPRVDEQLTPFVDYLTITDRYGWRRSLHHDGDEIAHSWGEWARWRWLQGWEDAHRLANAWTGW